MSTLELIALDRASVRSFDGDGHLHVLDANISKAVVNPYRGAEIPDWESLGLDPDKIYNLLRHPEELEKAADSFNGKPLLSSHKPVTAEDHDHAVTVGAVRDVRYEHPYLKGKLDIWPGEAIDAIKSNAQKELSSAYRYRADMTPGTYEGVPYEGIMRDISGNHVALVKEGRAGPDCVVGDSIENLRGIDMKKTVLSRKAVAAQGALVAYLAPKLAQDAKIDWTPTFKGVTAANYKAKSPAIAQDVLRQTKGKLIAKDEGLDLAEVAKVLEAVAELSPEEEKAEPPAMDDDRMEKLRAICGDKLGDEELAKILEMMAPAATDSAESGSSGGGAPVDTGSYGSDIPGTAENGASASMSNNVNGDEEETEEQKAARLKKEEEDKKNMVTKPAMDAAISRAVKAATDAAVLKQQQIFAAHREVTKAVGELPNCAMDSVEGIYVSGLKALNIDTDGLPQAALQPLFRTVVAERAAATSTKINPAVIAQDAAAAEDYAKRFPHANRLAR